MNGEGFAYFRWKQLQQWSPPVPFMWHWSNGRDVIIETFYPRSYLESLARAGETLRRIGWRSPRSFAEYLTDSATGANNAT